MGKDWLLKKNKLRGSSGQGVVEYAGALVIAAGIIAASIFIVPPAFGGFINTVYTSMATFLEGQMPK